MSALLNMNMMPIISWKGKTFYQITSQIKKNKNDSSNPTTNRNLFIHPPNKIYRREIATMDSHMNTCTNRNSASIDLLNMPNGYIVSETNRSNVGLVNILDIYSSTNKYENGDCIDKNVCASENAKRRVRSSGMVKRKFVSEKNNDTAYFTNSTQYLVSRNRTFKQNQYNHIRNGEPSLINTISQYKTNVYSPNGLSHCKQTTIVKDVNDTFYYLWTTFDYANIAGVKTAPDNTAVSSYKVVIPPGSYDVSALNTAFHAVMLQNTHYYINKRFGSYEFLMNIIYNNVENKIELQSYSNFDKWDTTLYSVPTLNGVVVGTPIPTYTGSNSTDYRFPVFYFPNNCALGHIMGFQTGFYPNIESIGSRNVGTTPSGMMSNEQHSIFPLYDIMHYKPNNTRFAVQGAVSSSDRVTRVKYDTITRSGLSFQLPYGKEVTNALAYGVPGNIYTLKDKYGYPNKQTPVFCKSSGEMKCANK